MRFNLPTCHQLVVVLPLPLIQLPYDFINHLKASKLINTIYLDADHGDCVPDPTCSANVQLQRALVCIVQCLFIVQLISLRRQGGAVL